MAHMTMSYIHYYWCLKQTLTYSCSHFLSISGGAPYRWFEELLFVKSASGGGVHVAGVRVGGVHADNFYPAVLHHQLNN